MSLDGLQKWEIGDRMLSQVLAGKRLEQVHEAERRRGALPPGELGLQILDEISAGVALIARAAEEHLGDQPSASLDVSTQLGDVQFRGTVNDVYGRTLVTASYSRLSSKHRIASWVRLLAVAAATGDTDWHAVTLGRAADDARSARRATLTTPDNAIDLLRALVDVRHAGLREPLPLGVRSSAAYAEVATWNLGEAYEKARAEWTSTGSGPYRKIQENDDSAICTVHGDDAPFSILWDAPAPHDERWVPDEARRFVQLALRVWRPLLDHEEVLYVR